MAAKLDVMLPAASLPLTPSVIIGFLAVAVFLVYRSMMPKPLPGIPYNPEATRNLFGDVPAMLKFKKKTGSARKWIFNQLEKHQSPLVQVFVQPFSSKPALIVSDYREFHDIVLRRTKEFDRAELVVQDFGGAIPYNQLTLRSSDPKLKHSKELMKDLMTPGFLNQVNAPAIVDRAALIVDVWEMKRKLANGRPFSCREDLLNGALDMIIGVAFPTGTTESATMVNIEMLKHLQPAAYNAAEENTEFVFPDIEVPKFNQSIVDISAAIGLVQNSPASRLHYWVMKQFHWLRNATAVKETSIRNYVNDGVARLSQPDAEMTCAMDRMILREMKSAQKANRTPDFHSRRMYDELTGYLIGGSDTTATTLAWFCKYIADNPAPQHKLRAILRATHTAAATERRLPSVLEMTKTTIPYLDAVVEETLRCAGTSPVNGRDALVDTQVLGHAVPKGTMVLFLIKGPGMGTPPILLDETRRSATAHATKGEWDVEDIGAFKPERWMVRGEDGEEEFDAAAGPSMPFGGGPRGCFGRRLAMLELKIVLTMLLWNFEFLRLPEELRSYDAEDMITTLPSMAHIKLRKAEW